MWKQNEFYFSKNIACFCYFVLIKFTLRKVWLIIINCRRICLNWIVSLYIDYVSIKNTRFFFWLFFFFPDTGRKVYINMYTLLSAHLIFTGLNLEVILFTLILKSLFSFWHLNSYFVLFQAGIKGNDKIMLDLHYSRYKKQMSEKVVA